MKRFLTSVALAMLLTPVALHAQTPDRQQHALRDRLMPAGDATVVLTASPTVQPANERVVLQPAARGSAGMGYMIAGAALFVAGFLADGDAGTVLILAGAGIGAYGLYLHFR